MELLGIQIVTDDSMEHGAWAIHYAPTMANELRKFKDVLACLGYKIDRIDISRDKVKEKHDSMYCKECFKRLTG